MQIYLIDEHVEEPEEIYNSGLGIIFNGENNMRPLEVEQLIDLSPTAIQCASTYAAFIGGSGFEEDLSNFNLSPYFWEKETPEDLLKDICESLSRHQGCFVHVRYNANFQKESFKVIPYTLCRVGKKDSKGFSGKVVIAPKGWGNYVNKKDIDVFDTYNPNPKIINEQVEQAGGWSKYRGQVFFFKLNKKYTYPKSLIEPAYLYARMERQMGLFYDSTIKRGFENITFIQVPEPESDEEKAELEKKVKKLQGGGNSSRYMIYTIKFNDDLDKKSPMQFDTLPNTTKADKYAHFEKSSSNFIRKAFKNIPPQLVDYVQGKLGNTSGEDLVRSQSVYNSMVAGDRKKVEILFSELFDNYKDAVPENWTINQHKLLDDGSVD